VVRHSSLASRHHTSRTRIGRLPSEKYIRISKLYATSAKEGSAQKVSLFTNRRDAILARFSLSRLDFQPVYEDRGDYVAIVVPDPSNRDR
jgi:hypothetical protein